MDCIQRILPGSNCLWPINARQMGKRAIRVVFSRKSTGAFPYEAAYRLMNAAIALISLIPIINRIALSCFSRQLSHTPPKVQITYRDYIEKLQTCLDSVNRKTTELDPKNWPILPLKLGELDAIDKEATHLREVLWESISDVEKVLVDCGIDPKDGSQKSKFIPNLSEVKQRFDDTLSQLNIVSREIRKLKIVLPKIPGAYQRCVQMLNLYKGNPLRTLDGSVSIGMTMDELIYLLERPSGWFRNRILIIRGSDPLALPASMMMEIEIANGEKRIFDIVTGKVATKQNRKLLYRNEYQLARDQQCYFKTESGMKYYVKKMSRRILPSLYRDACRLNFSNGNQLPHSVEGFNKAKVEAEEIIKALNSINGMFLTIQGSTLDRRTKLRKELSDYSHHMQIKNNELLLKMRIITNNLNTQYYSWSPFLKEYTAYSQMMRLYKVISRENPTLQTHDGKIAIGLTPLELENLYCGRANKIGVTVVKVGGSGFARNIIKQFQLGDGSQFYFDIVSGKGVQWPSSSTWAEVRQKELSQA